MYKKNIPLEVIYIFVLVENFIQNKSQKKLNKLSDFFTLISMFDIKTYFILHSIFINSYDINYLKTLLLDNNADKDEKIRQLRKFREFLLKFIKRRIGKPNINIMENKLNNTINILNKYQEEAFVDFLSKICKYLKEGEKSFISYIIFCAIEEYLDLFLDADKILFNNKLIDEYFKNYFDLLHIKPQNICFLNRKNNIKIMQNFFPFEILCKIFCLIKNIKLENSNEKYFLIEYDKRLVSTKTSELLLHETGHLLNLKIYNFQGCIFELLHEKNKTVNAMILNGWLNEIIADIIGNNTNKNFINAFNIIDDNVESMTYPPSHFRKALLTNEEYDFSILKNQETRQVAMLIYNNLETIKEIIQLNNT